MVPSQTLSDTVAELLAADAAFLAAAAVKHVHLSMAPFTPEPDLGVGDVIEATFDGYAELSAPAGAQHAFTDPTTGQRIVQMIPPAGGWHWETSGVTDLPMTIYGFYVTDLADAVVLGSALLVPPIVLTGSGQALDLDADVVRFTFPIPPMS